MSPPLDTKFASEVENVFAGVNSYLPFPSLSAFTIGIAVRRRQRQLHQGAAAVRPGLMPSTTITDTNIGGSAHVWTAVGNAQIDTARIRFRRTASLLLDGTGDWVTTPDHADFTLGSSDFTIDCWFNCTNAGGHHRPSCGAERCSSASQRIVRVSACYRTSAMP